MTRDLPKLVILANVTCLEWPLIQYVKLEECCTLMTHMAICDNQLFVTQCAIPTIFIYCLHHVACFRYSIVDNDHLCLDWPNLFCPKARFYCTSHFMLRLCIITNRYWYLHLSQMTHVISIVIYSLMDKVAKTVPRNCLLCHFDVHCFI